MVLNMVYHAGYRYFFFFKQKTAYEMRISDWSSDVCSSDLIPDAVALGGAFLDLPGERPVEIAQRCQRIGARDRIPAQDRDFLDQRDLARRPHARASLRAVATAVHPALAQQRHPDPRIDAQPRPPGARQPTARATGSNKKR